VEDEANEEHVGFAGECGFGDAGGFGADVGVEPEASWDTNSLRMGDENEVIHFLSFYMVEDEVRMTVVAYVRATLVGACLPFI
jgi:hypothetical protein